jgi:hypothetical protein
MNYYLLKWIMIKPLNFHSLKTGRQLETLNSSCYTRMSTCDSSCDVLIKIKLYEYLHFS